MELLGSHFILLVSFLFPTTMLITFALAVSSKHVYPIMPFISYTGDLPIESCIFSLGLNITACLYIIISVLRYNQIFKFCEEDNHPHMNSILRMNRNSLMWALTSALGLSATGSFQELHMAFIHRGAAIVCTYSGFVYFWYQTVLSELLIDALNTRKLFCIRFALSLASTTLHLIAPILVGILDTAYPRSHEDTLLWSIDEEGWHLHVCCSVLEWIVFLLNVTYISTFYDEFKHVRILKDRILFEKPERQRRHTSIMGTHKNR